MRKTMIALLAATLIAGTLAGTALASHPRAALFTTVLTGAAERPGPGDPDAIGAAVVLVVPRTDTVCWAVTWKRIDGTVTMAHIHEGGADTFGPVRVLFFEGQSFSGTRGFHSGCVRSPGFADLIAANPENFYVNVHSSVFGPGAIRGQLP
jgi:hypothetical protein